MDLVLKLFTLRILVGLFSAGSAKKYTTQKNYRPENSHLSYSTQAYYKKKPKTTTKNYYGSGHKIKILNSVEPQLRRDLFAKYDDESRPVKDPGYNKEAVELEFGLEVQKILEINVVEEHVTMSLWLKFKWIDHSLIWDPKAYDDIVRLVVPAAKVWKPDIFLYNSIAEEFDNRWMAPVKVRYNGVVEWKPAMIAKTSCSMTPTFFPFDIQKCKLVFGTLVSSQAEMKWTLFEDNKDRNIPVDMKPNEWNILSFRAEKEKPMAGRACGDWYSCANSDQFPEQPQFVTYTLICQRFRALGVINYIVPGLCISTLAIMVFMLPADCGEKIGLAITSLLALVVSIEVVSASIPPVSDARDAPVVIVFFTMALVMILISTFISCIVLRCNLHDSNTQSKMGFMLRIVFLQVLPAILRMKPPGAEKIPSLFEWSTWVRNPNFTKLDEMSEISDLPGDEHQRELRQKAKSLRGQLTDGQTAELAALFQIQEVMKGVRAELWAMNRRVEESGIDDVYTSQWRFLANVLDTLFLWLSMIGVLSVTGITLYQIPGFGNILLDAVFKIKAPTEVQDVGRLNWYRSIDHGCWKLVRRTDGSTGRWHPATDRLVGTERYGIFKDDPLSEGTFSRNYDISQYDQFLFSTGDTSKWAIVNISEIVGDKRKIRFLRAEMMICSTDGGCNGTAYGKPINASQTINGYNRDNDGPLITLQRTDDFTYNITQGPALPQIETAKNHPLICRERYTLRGVPALGTVHCKYQYPIYRGGNHPIDMNEEKLVLNHVELKGVNVFVRKKPTGPGFTCTA